jgi:hypothetical protein
MSSPWLDDLGQLDTAAMGMGNSSIDLERSHPRKSGNGLDYGSRILQRCIDI